MDWQHIYIPILPRPLADYLAAPMPFLIGVPAPIMAESVKQHELSEVVVLDADEQVSVLGILKLFTLLCKQTWSRGCASAALVHATFDIVYSDSRVNNLTFFRSCTLPSTTSRRSRATWRPT